MKAGPVLLVIDHRDAIRSAKIAATDLHNATLSIIAYGASFAPSHRPGATTALFESFRAWSKLIDERTLATSCSELV